MSETAVMLFALGNVDRAAYVGQATELHKLEDDEDPPSTEHVETRRQKAMREGKE